MNADAQRILNFWFGEQGAPGFGQLDPRWFTKSDAFDRQLRENFGDLVESALADGLQDWQAPQSPSTERVALILLLDQFTRNIYRATPRMFAGDTRALSVAKAMVASGEDQQLPAALRMFTYLPFEHAEDLPLQYESLRLFGQIKDDPAMGNTFQYSVRHHEIIERFGRFPHRNETLGRQSTEEEIEFLKTPGSGF